MKVLVTGAGGFLGIEVVKRLLAHGYNDIRCMLRDTAKAARLLEAAGPYPDANVELCAGNLCSRADCTRAVAGVSLVFHLAAGLKGLAADLILNSVVASRNLLEALAARRDIAPSSVRVVLISSFSVYGVADLPRGALVDEQTPQETHPEWRDNYSFSKLKQEQLFADWQRTCGFELVVLRPGVIYGRGGGHLSTRIGLSVGPVFIHLGRRNILPLSYVENCAEAVVVAGTHPSAAGQIYNVHDDDLPSTSDYLRLYKKRVRNLRSIFVPYALTRFLSHRLESYRRRSLGQLPPILTPYKVASMWKGNRFSNAKLRSTGWTQLVKTREALDQTMKYFAESTPSR